MHCARFIFRDINFKGLILENIIYQPMSFEGKNMKRKKKGANVKEKGRKGKERENGK